MPSYILSLVQNEIPLFRSQGPTTGSTMSYQVYKDLPDLTLEGFIFKGMLK